MTPAEKIQRLRVVIRKLHGIDASHLRTESVQKALDGQKVWDGAVELFALKGHPKAGLGYAWEHETDDRGRQVVAVLGMPPIKSALDAVRVLIAAQKSAPDDA